MTAAILLSAAVPVFAGFGDAHYQRFDPTVRRVTDAFNAAHDAAAGATGEQARKIPDLPAALVKAQMIQESGGRDILSRVAWSVDPLQVNVPGDWSPYKRYLGLRKPRRRNEGSFETNLRAGLFYLARKGFGASGQPAANRADATFDGWEQALKRYNGRTDKINGVPYRDAYARRILARATNPATNVVIRLRAP